MERVSMNKIRDMIRLSTENNQSNRQIAKSLKVSRPVVAQYITAFKKSGLLYQDIKDISDESLLDILKVMPRRKTIRYKDLEQEFEYITKEIKRTGVTLQLLWEEYRKKHPDGYSYTQFCFHYQVFRHGSELCMHMEHKAGDKMFAGFTGKKLYITDLISGIRKDVEVFVALLGASQFTYVEGVMTQVKEDWIKMNEHALWYFGGVPQAIVPDCLKSAVTKADKYEPDINQEYYDFARHYNTVILPARVRHPKDKALVEGAVNIVYSWIFARLRDRTFYSLKELNTAIWEELERYNARPMQRLKVSRRELFEQVEKDALKPLPPDFYEIKTFGKLKVQFNYHIYLSADRHYYSVPYQYRGQNVTVASTESTVEIYAGNIRIAFHKRDRNPNGYTTIKEHMPLTHRWVSEWSPERIIGWALKKGESVKELIKAVLESKEHPEQGFKVCLGILNLSKKYGDFRLNRACKKALEWKYFSLKGIKNILENKLDAWSETELFCESELTNDRMSHANIRGSGYYN
jgi:transposase